MPKGKNKKVIGLMKDELGKKDNDKSFWIVTYCYLIDDGSEDQKAKGTKNCVVKVKLKSENYKTL